MAAILSLEEALELWLEALRASGASSATLTTDRHTVSRFVRFLRPWATTLDEVQPAHIRKWLLSRMDMGLRPASVHNYYRIPRTFWRWCLREQLTTNDPFRLVDPPKVQPVPQPALTKEELDRLLATWKQGKGWYARRAYALCLLLVSTGLRIHEAHQLRVADSSKEQVVIRGKWNKERVVILSPEVRLALHRYVKAYHLHELEPDDPLWWGQFGPLTLDGLKQVVRDAGAKAGLKIGPHTLRRTFATNALRSGMSMEAVRILMGHADYRILQQYLSLTTEDLKSELGKLNQFMRGSRR